MTNAGKGVLLSALVLPGLGQFVLKRRLRGSLLMLAVLGLLGAMMVLATRKALAIMAHIQVQAGQIDLSAIEAAVRQAVNGTDTLLSLLLLVLWLGASIDAYLLGRQLDRQPPLA